MHFKKFLLFLSHYVKTGINSAFSAKVKPTKLPQDVLLVLHFMEEVVRFGRTERELFTQVLGGQFILDNFKLNYQL